MTIPTTEAEILRWLAVTDPVVAAREIAGATWRREDDAQHTRLSQTCGTCHGHGHVDVHVRGCPGYPSCDCEPFERECARCDGYGDTNVRDLEAATQAALEKP